MITGHVIFLPSCCRTSAAAGGCPGHRRTGCPSPAGSRWQAGYSPSRRRTRPCARRAGRPRRRRRVRRSCARRARRRPGAVEQQLRRGRGDLQPGGGAVAVVQLLARRRDEDHVAASSAPGATSVAGRCVRCARPSTRQRLLGQRQPGQPVRGRLDDDQRVALRRRPDRVEGSASSVASVVDRAPSPGRSGGPRRCRCRRPRPSRRAAR